MTTTTTTSTHLSTSQSSTPNGATKKRRGSKRAADALNAEDEEEESLAPSSPSSLASMADKDRSGPSKRSAPVLKTARQTRVLRTARQARAAVKSGGNVLSSGRGGDKKRSPNDQGDAQTAQPWNKKKSPKRSLEPMTTTSISKRRSSKGDDGVDRDAPSDSLLHLPKAWRRLPQALLSTPANKEGGAAFKTVEGALKSLLDFVVGCTDKKLMADNGGKDVPWVEGVCKPVLQVLGADYYLGRSRSVVLQAFRVLQGVAVRKGLSRRLVGLGVGDVLAAALQHYYHHKQQAQKQQERQQQMEDLAGAG